MRPRELGHQRSWAMNGVMMSGAALAILGLIGLAIPVFTTQQTKEVAKIGDLKIQTTENESHVVPPMLAGGALALGVILVAAGLFPRRQTTPRTAGDNAPLPAPLPA